MRYGNWSINGYEKETSPNLKKVGSLISFSKNFSNGNSTFASLPLIITQGTPLDQIASYTQNTIVSLFKEAGYRTTWIALQDIFGYRDNKEEPDEVFELYKNRSDLDILPVFDSIINSGYSKNKFVVINMIGGHGKTSLEYSKFKPNSSLKSYPISMENKEIHINDYDNMILLEDDVLAQMINMMEAKGKSSVLLFTADHGTNLFDENLFGYGSINPTINETHVPLFIWGSEKYILENKVKYSNLQHNKDLLTTNDNVFYTLSDLASIKYPSFDEKMSIAGPSYVEPSSRYVLVNRKAVKVEPNY